MTTEKIPLILSEDSIFTNIEKKVPPTNFIGGLFPTKQVSILASKAGAGKTWYCIQLISDLSKGRPVLGSSQIQNSKKVLYLVGETGEDIVVQRFQSLASDTETEKVKLLSSYSSAKAGRLIDLDTKAGIVLLSNYIKASKADLVIIDTLMSFRFGDENSNKEITLVMQRLKAIAEELDVAILCIHHLRKKSALMKAIESGVDQDEVIGGSALVRFASNVYILTGEEVKEFKCVKSWWKKPESVYYKMKQSDLGLIEFMVEENADMTNARIQTCEIAWNMKGNFTPTMLAQAARVSITTATQAIASMLNEGKLKDVRRVTNRPCYVSTKQESDDNIIDANSKNGNKMSE